MAKKKEEKKASGRPREHDRDQIANELIEWAKKPDSVNLNKFCATREPPLWPELLIRWSKEDTIFRQSYETAKAFLGFRREEWLSQETLHVKAYDLNATNYDYFLKQEKKDQLAYEARLSAEITSNVNEIDAKRFDTFMDRLSDLQSSARSIASTKIKNEDKS